MFLIRKFRQDHSCTWIRLLLVVIMGAAWLLAVAGLIAISVFAPLPSPYSEFVSLEQAEWHEVYGTLYLAQFFLPSVMTVLLLSVIHTEKMRNIEMVTNILKEHLQ